MKVEHSDVGGTFVKPQSGKDVVVALEHEERGGGVSASGVVLSIGLKPRPVSPQEELLLVVLLSLVEPRTLCCLFCCCCCCW